MEKYTPEELEDFLKERADQYLMYPSDHVWDGIQKRIQPNKAWMYFSLILLLVGISSSLVLMNVTEQKEVPAKTGQIAYQFIPHDIIKDKYKDLNSINVSIKQKRESSERKLNKITSALSDLNPSGQEQNLNLENFSFREKVLIPESILNLSALNTQKPFSTGKVEKKNFIASTLDIVLAKAKIIGKKAVWQYYLTPTVSYRKLTGQASNTSYQYTSSAYNTNSLFAKDVNDAVRHRPGIGLELGTAMLYPLTKKLSFKTGIQLNYSQYQIEAFSGSPEIASFGMNNFGYGARSPINTLSYYRNADGYTPTVLRNQHYMFSIPIGLDYVVAGNKKINFSIASTILPTYVIANHAYLISTNLKNYAQEPTLNRRWNLNSSIEASLNVQMGDFKWSLAPQYRYQLISSFKNKYPIKENLMDLGVKLSLIRTIR
jgi:hypothetical protein